MKTVVFSDVHLESTPEARERRAEFVAFLERTILPDVNRVIILGDLFDFWFEYKEVIFSGYYDVLRAFSAIHERGVEMHLVCGNHDFWAGTFLREHLGFVIHHEPACFDFGGRRALLLHGDGQNPRDFGYRIYKRIARARLVIALFGLLHPDWAMALAKRISRTSGRLLEAEELARGSDAEAWRAFAEEGFAQGPEAQILRAFAREILDKGEADIVMAGHAHAPTLEQYPTPSGPGLYINVGDWTYHRSYTEWDGQEFRLLEAPQDKR